MHGIARTVELFNQAFRLAWPHLSKIEIPGSDTGQLLSESIRRQLKAGATDAVRIAADVITEIQSFHIGP